MTVPVLIVRCPHCGNSVRVRPSSGSELVTCPAQHCRQAFRVEVPAAEPVASLNLPPSMQHAPATQIPLAGQTPNTADERQTIHLKMFRRYPYRCLAYLL